MNVRLFLNSLHHFITRTFSPTVGEFRWGQYVSLIKAESLYELHYQCTLTYPIYSTCPTDACIVCLCYPC